jgi:DNA-binding MarR family transcriptional regulator
MKRKTPTDLVPDELIPEFVHSVRRRLECAGVLPDRIAVLLHLWSRDDMAEEDLAREMDITSDALGALLEEMREARLVRRRRRGSVGAKVALSRRLEAMRSIIGGAATDVAARAFEGVPDADRDTIARVLGQAVVNLRDDGPQRHQ